MKTWMKVGISLVTLGVTATVIGFVVVPQVKKLIAKRKEKSDGSGSEQTTPGANAKGTDDTAAQNKTATTGRENIIGQTRQGADITVSSRR